jgi:ribosomal protein S27AE
VPCIRCGNEKSLAHHEDYDKPLDVMWLCQPCHKQRHKELKEKF